MNRFLIASKDWRKIQSYARCSYGKWKAEIGGMAVMIQSPTDSKTKDIEKDDWLLLDPVILKQEVSGGNCDLDKDALAEYYGKYALKYKKYNFRFCWWHSHHTMAAFWSGTDLTAIEEFNEGDISFALVVNLKQEYKFRVSIWKPIEVHQDVELKIYDKKSKAIPKTIIKEVEEQCTKEAPITTGYQYRGYNTHINGNGNQLSLLGSNDTPPTTNNILHELDTENVQGYIEMVDIVKNLNHRYIMGELKYPEYASKIDTTNQEALEQGVDFEIQLISKDELFDAVQTQDEHDFVEYNGLSGGSFI
jgi:hypothetical protein